MFFVIPKQVGILKRNKDIIVIALRFPIELGMTKILLVVGVSVKRRRSKFGVFL